LLDAVERGEIDQVTRAGRVVAGIRPASPTIGRALRGALANSPCLDDTSASEPPSATSLLTEAASDPWRAGYRQHERGTDLASADTSGPLQLRDTPGDSGEIALPADGDRSAYYLPMKTACTQVLTEAFVSTKK
jgi:antitoxin (DNA-binding transcriptional repressor) of toxin-antitoxin stability system